MNPAIKTLLKQFQKLEAKGKKQMDAIAQTTAELDRLGVALDALGHKAAQTAPGAASLELSASLSDIEQPAFTARKP